MSAAAVAVCVSVVIIAVIASVLTLRWRNRVRRQYDESPQDRYRREILDIRHTVHIRTRPRRWRRRRQRVAGSFWATGMTSHGAVGSAWAAGSDGGDGGDGGGCGGGGGSGGGCGGGT